MNCGFIAVCTELRSHGHLSLVHLDSHPTMIGSGSDKSKRGDPTWEIAKFYPRQGDWTESSYLALNTNRFIELDDGCLDFLPLPDLLHQTVVREMFRALSGFVEHHELGQVFFGSLPIRLGPGHFRTPDILYLRPHRVQKLREIGFHGQPEGADLVVEVVSPGDENRKRDLIEKRHIYAKAGISEYWIADPETHRLLVLVLDGADYRVHGDFGPSDGATSVVLARFEVSVREVFAVADFDN